MPMHPVTSTLMYRGICTIPDILSYSAPVNLPEDEVEEIREAFKVFDRDGNGFISKQELGMAMRSLGYMPNEVELEVIIQRLDMDGDGQVDFEEFVTLLGPKLTAAGMPDKFNGTDFDSVFWKTGAAAMKAGLKKKKKKTFGNVLATDVSPCLALSHCSPPQGSKCLKDTPVVLKICILTDLVCC
uniref:Calcium binding protein 7 n=1 Tax=Fundulus heteroclitus TaxID=8078 RepID=A0A3Q2PEN0_FUNHE